MLGIVGLPIKTNANIFIHTTSKENWEKKIRFNWNGNDRNTLIKIISMTIQIWRASFDG